ncbi:antitoxin [Corynebacterium sp. sy017]|uniref:antitoxin n=1 Tax=unclassified Corynebacterium TaxID=2624378 RepID=UPI0011869382|nr:MULTISPECIES: antitoxin [unclassified Corynebacterium]MBP3088102.1 antitoxin [Corynebacterium sp. sy017]QDZ43049.1 antitoxin [Corynebacterium sp. sy039]TSD92625.1 antitoxin [Corynebacterium sp. SY003]
MGIFDKAKDLLKNEETSDKVLDQAEKLATDKLGADKADKVKKVRDTIDGKIGEN